MNHRLLNVWYRGRRVGRLAETKQKCLAFEYDADWLRDGFPVSPFHLPLEKKVFVAPREPFNGNFGVFNDSLPDGWGRLLIDRLLIQKHLVPSEVSTLDRLAIVGSSGMGALEYLPEENWFAPGATDDIATLAKAVEEVLNEKYEGKLEELARIGGSSGGARPKVLIEIDGEEWLVKFRGSMDSKNIGKQEFQYMRAARDAGLETPEFRLFEKKYFGVRRFDRGENGEKIFMISAAGLLDASYRMPAMDYNDLMSATLSLTRNYSEAEKIFRLMCFNVFAHNRDDHAKNFSFLFEDGKWRVSPVYDLTRSDGFGGEHATSIDGEGRRPDEKNILRVAEKAGMDLKKAKKTMEEVKEAVKTLG